MSNKKKPGPQRERLPPMTPEGFQTYLRNQGFRLNPTLGDSRDSHFTYDKPLPDGRRLHGLCKIGTKYINCEEHIDASDPYRSPIGHIVTDVLLDEPTKRRYRIHKRKKTKKKKSRKRTK